MCKLRVKATRAHLDKLYGMINTIFDVEGNMSIFEIFIVGIGLAMDAFSVAICKGLSVRKVEFKHGIITGGYFGLAQAIMPTLGFFFGALFKDAIKQWDHWIAFGLLGILGIQMIREAIKTEECPVGNFSFLR